MSTNDAVFLAPEFKRRVPSLLAVNTFLVLGMIVLIVSSLLSEGTLGHYVIGVGVEFLLAFVAMFFIKAQKLSVRETLRLHWPGWKPLALSVVLAVGLWVLGVFFNVITSLVFGYVAPSVPDSYPQTLLESLAFLAGTLIAAPLCEEVMFRGYVQRAYGRSGPWTGILVSSVLFSVYHLRFQGLFALIPVAIGLGIVAWRSNSILPGIVLHAVYNSIASFLMLCGVFLPMQVFTALILGMVCLAVLFVPLAIAALWGLWQVTQPPRPQSLPRLTGFKRWIWLLPLAVLLAAYGYFGVFYEVMLGRFPEAFAVDSIDLQAPAGWESASRWSYGLYDALSKPVGQAECSLEPQAESFVFVCESHQEAFDNDLPIEGFLGLSDGGRDTSWSQNVTWSRNGGHLLTLEGDYKITDAALSWNLPSDGEPAVLSVSDADGDVKPVSISGEALFHGEWPWRLSALPFQIAYGGSLPLFWVDDAGQLQSSDAQIVVRGGEPTWTPAGIFITWKVTVTYVTLAGDEVELVAWYEADAPHTLVRYDDGVVSYLLEAVE